ncbi:AlpA family transcriptional regulator [Legionella sp. 31fI33]|uniref:helix-turn-helix transcriptional regulator n=1 Tax=Legionella sp. 31fI33 TaxID=2886376 RepID=UPI001E39D078|nr:hypothetical protein [Legionella sp. 31fI33]MCC5016058.1 hypothetical protein [Legionella sp. 31fI33]
MKQNSLLLYPSEAAALLGVRATKFYELKKLPDFPRPKNPLGKRPMYLREELESWVKNLD